MFFRPMESHLAPSACSFLCRTASTFPIAMVRPKENPQSNEIPYYEKY